MTDILKELDVNVRCDQCGDFTVSADVIAESQQLIARGCPGSPYECPAELFASFVDPAALEALVRAWKEVEKSARGHSNRALLIARPHLDISFAPELAADAPAQEGARAGCEHASK